MAGKDVLLRKKLFSLAVVVAAALAGTAAPACATTASVTWTTQQDFEGIPPVHTTRQNVDTTTTPGDVVIGPTNDPVSGGVITLGTADKIYSIGAERTSIAVIDPVTKTVLRTIPLTARAAGMTYNSANNKLYVGIYNDNKVNVFNGSDDTLVKTITAGSGAYPAAYNPATNKVYVANTQDRTVTVIKGDDDTVIATVPVITGPYTANYDAALNKIYFTNKYNHTVSVIDGDSEAVSNVSIEPVSGIIGGQPSGNVGLRADLQALGITAADRIHLRIDCDPRPLLPSQKVELQVRSATSSDQLDSAIYTGPDPQDPTKWYGATSCDNDDIVLATGYAPFMELQLRLSYDDTASPVLHSVSLDFETYPDLTITDGSVPPTASIGKPLTVSATVLNQGSEAAGASSTNFLLTDTNGNQTVLCSAATPALNAHTATTPPVSCNANVPNIPVGTYFVTAIADGNNQVIEGDETNNSKLLGSLTIVAPDLVINSVNGPVNGLTGRGITITSSVKNQGQDSAGSSVVGFYLVDGNGTRISMNCQASVPQLAAGDVSSPVSTSCTIPSGIAAGTYTLAANADDTNIVQESNEANNFTLGNSIALTVPYVDLVIDSVSGSGTATIGSTISISTTVRNNGNDSAGTFQVGMYLVSAANGATTFVCDRNVNGLAANGAFDTATVTCQVPSMPTGDYFLQATADYTNAVAESNEDNNTTRAATTTSIICLFGAINPAAYSIADKSPAGSGANSDSDTPGLSSDGRYVVFSSNAANLVAGDTFGWDIFRLDRYNNTMIKASVGLNGAVANGQSKAPYITPDGRYVSFRSFATNLVTTTNGYLYRYDTQTGTTTVVPNSANYEGPLSADGRYIVFVGTDYQVYVYDFQNNTQELISKAADGTRGNGSANSVTMTPDARYVAFSSTASNLVPGDTNGFNDVFVVDRTAHTIERISVSTQGVQGNNTSHLGAWTGRRTISDDGRYVAFESSASNLVSGDTNNTSDIFVRDRQTNTTLLVSANRSGVPGNNISEDPAISGNGRFVTFKSQATDLVTTTRDSGTSRASYVSDLYTGTIQAVSLCSNGTVCTGEGPVINFDGSLIAFLSSMTLATVDNSAYTNVYVVPRSCSQ